MYLEHFGLSDAPFQFTASPTALFMSPTHREGLAALEWGLLHEPSGLTLVAGESGLGKTTLACALLAKHCDQVLIAYLANPKLPFDQLLADVLGQMGIRGARSGKAAMLRAYTTATAGVRVAIVIDEAQLLSDDALEEVRLLSNIEHDRHKAAQIILLGQVELLHRLMEPRWRHLNERIGARTMLTPLTELESRDYLRHRVAACDGDLDRLFSKKALAGIVHHGGGIPRRLNTLAHNALLSAYCASANEVSARIVKAVAAECGVAEPIVSSLDSPPSKPSRPVWAVLKPVLSLGLMALLGFIAAYAGLGRLIGRQWRASVPERIGSAKIARSSDAPAFKPQPSMGAALLPAAPAQRPPETSAAPAAVPKPKVAKAIRSKPAAIDRHYVVVARGDTLSAISVHYFGSRRMVAEMLRLNPQIRDASKIVPGEIVYLPTPADLASNED